MKEGFLLILIFLCCRCTHNYDDQPLFSDVTAKSGVSFQNELVITKRLNPYTYRNYYNGAGVAVGDINNDGLLDIYFTGNQVDNKLYLNLGNFKFKDVTDIAGVACHDVWSTGVTFVDINADGLLDIYVCKSGDPDAPHRYNELFINNGDLTFTEKSKEFGLDIKGLSVQAAFFDYDKDGDLDCYLLTNSITPIGSFDIVKDQRKIPDPNNSGNKFLRNNNGHFEDFSEQSNIYRSSIGFGLGITLGDFNTDGWTDIYVSNDFFERDYLYVNNQNGTFKESLEEYFYSISMGSMGADFADLDNDGENELLVTEMLPDSLSRKKSKTVFESWDKHQLSIQNGYFNQFSRNTLQKKIGNNNYAEIGRLTGLASSEWSWGALIFDMNNDGFRDVFIANGIYKDLLDRDYLTYDASPDNIRRIIKNDENGILKLINLMPSSAFPNFTFRNDGNLKFTRVSNSWGLGDPMFSSGSAYGDLDNDGDLDLIVNNLNSPSIVYRNNTDTSEFKSISISLSGDKQNKLAIGARVKVYNGANVYAAENFVTRGFQSSVQPSLTIGLGKITTNRIDSIYVEWPDSGSALLYNVKANSALNIHKSNQGNLSNSKGAVDQSYGQRKLVLELVTGNIFRHRGSGMVDFNRDRLLPMMYSNETPLLTKADVDGNGISEIYISGGKDQAGAIIGFKNGKMVVKRPKEFSHDSIAEETRSVFFDADNDGDLDFYFASGGRFFSNTSSVLMDKLFLNNGHGDFIESTNPLPFKKFISTSVVKPIDFDNDHDWDLFVGERFDPYAYGLGGRGYILENLGSGIFSDVTNQIAPSLINIGMVTDASVVDVDNDKWSDLVLVGDWMPITILKNDKKNFVNISSQQGLTATEGWWHTIESADLNKDGVIDFVLGNHGLNSFFKNGDRMYVNDFDRNGSIEQIFCTKENDNYYPIVDKDEFLSQLPSFKKNLLYYKDFSKKSINDLISKKDLDNSKTLQVNILSSIILLSDNSGYKIVELPLEAQYAPIYSFLISDLDNDGIEDILAGGNQYLVKPQFGSYDASSGWFFKGTMKNNNYYLNHGQSLNVKGQIRDIELLEIKNLKFVLFSKYDDELEIFKVVDL